MLSGFFAALLISLADAPSAGTSQPAATPTPVPLIFDTDIGNDIDDALALAMIHSLADAGETRLLAVTITNDSPWSAACTDILNTFYRRPDVPIGLVRNGVRLKEAKFTQPLATREADGRPLYPHDLTATSETPDAVVLLRETLARHPQDGEVVMVVVGFSTNIARLLDSPPDAISPLNGKALVARKVRLLSIMAGAFGTKSFPEFNIVKDIPSAQRVYRDWPTPVITSGYEVGEAILYPGDKILSELNYVPHHPLKDAYILYGSKMPYDRPCWDLTSVLYAVRPDAAYFKLSEAGRIDVDNKGITIFTAQPGGRHRRLILEQGQVDRIRRTFVELASKPPRIKRT